MAKRDMPVGTVNSKVDKKKVENEPILLKVANCTKLNVRQFASRDSQIMATIPLGTVVKVIGVEESGWFHIEGFGDETKRSDNSTPGYILAQYTEEV